MYVTVSGSGKSKVIQFVEQHRIPNSKKKKTVVIETIGNYHELLAEDPEIMTKLKAEAKRRTAEKKVGKAPITIEISKQTITTSEDALPSYKIGHSLIYAVWRELELDKFFNKHLDHRYPDNVQEAIFTLVMHRIMNPKSIRATQNNLSNFVGLKLHHRDLYYQSLSLLDELTDKLIDHICDIFDKKAGERRPIALYDVTTYAFESVESGELRMFGFSKDNKNNEVQVVMGLLVDTNGLPISFQLFPGDTMDQSTLVDAVSDLKRRFKMDKIVIVADRGLNGKENLLFLSEEGHDYVIGYSLKKAPEAIKALALDINNWDEVTVDENGEVKFCSKDIDYEYEIKVEMTDEEKAEERALAAKNKKRGRAKKYKTVILPVKIHITWDAKRANKDRKDRERVLEKVKKTLENPGNVKAQLKRGRNQYLDVDIKTDEVKLDEGRIASQQQYDGFYAIVTNQETFTTEQVVAIYNDLWQIEESFRILKTDLRARPVYVWKDSHVKGHFTLCYLSFCITRYIQYRHKKAKGTSISTEKICDAIYAPSILVHDQVPQRLIPTNVTETYISLLELFEQPYLTTVMSANEFKKITKLDINRK